MSETISGAVTTTSRFLHQSSAPFSITYAANVVKEFQKTFGTSDVSKLYYNTYTVTTTPTSIDLTALTDAYGVALNFGTVKSLQVINNDTTNNLTIGGGTNGLFAALPVLVGQTATSNDPGSCLTLTTNVTVDGTHKILQLVASAASVVVDVFIAGS